MAKRNNRRPLLALAASVKSFKLPGVDLGTLQADFLASGKAKRTAETKLENAQNAFDNANQKHAAYGERLKAASRAVLACA